METRKVLLDKALKLYKERERRKNGGVRPKGIITKLSLGRLVYPDSTDGTIRVSMNDMSKGKMIKVSCPWVGIICEALGIDANFMFGLPSVYDAEYDKYFN